MPWKSIPQKHTWDQKMLPALSKHELKNSDQYQGMHSGTEGRMLSTDKALLDLSRGVLHLKTPLGVRYVNTTVKLSTAMVDIAVKSKI